MNEQQRLYLVQARSDWRLFRLLKDQPVCHMLMIVLVAVTMPLAMQWRSHAADCGAKAQTARERQIEELTKATYDSWQAVSCEWRAMRNQFQRKPPDYSPPRFCSTIGAGPPIPIPNEKDWNGQRDLLVEECRQRREKHFGAAVTELTNAEAAASLHSKWMSPSYRIRTFFLGDPDIGSLEANDTSK